MNAARRKEIEGLCAELVELKSRIETVAGDERDYFDNMPENMQSSERAQKAEEAADALDEAANGIDEIVSTLETAAE